MSTIEEQDERLFRDVTRGLDKNEFDIAGFARRRDRILGSPNVVDNFLVPACSLIFGRAPAFSIRTSRGESAPESGHKR